MSFNAAIVVASDRSHCLAATVGSLLGALDCDVHVVMARDVSSADSYALRQMTATPRVFVHSFSAQPMSVASARYAAAQYLQRTYGYSYYLMTDDDCVCQARDIFDVSASIGDVVTFGMHDVDNNRGYPDWTDRRYETYEEFVATGHDPKLLVFQRVDKSVRVCSEVTTRKPTGIKRGTYELTASMTEGFRIPFPVGGASVYPARLFGDMSPLFFWESWPLGKRGYDEETGKVLAAHSIPVTYVGGREFLHLYTAKGSHFDASPFDNKDFPEKQ